MRKLLEIFFSLQFAPKNSGQKAWELVWRVYGNWVNYKYVSGNVIEQNVQFFCTVTYLFAEIAPSELLPKKQNYQKSSQTSQPNLENSQWVM